MPCHKGADLHISLLKLCEVFALTSAILGPGEAFILSKLEYAN
jgi:hypothetical protein